MRDDEIRELTIDDLPEIIARVRDAANESGWLRDLEFDTEYLASRIAWMIESSSCLVIGTHDVGSVMLAHIGSAWYSPDEQAFEDIVYVHPHVRCSGRAKKLVEHYEAWAKEKGVVRINLGVSLPICPEQVSSIYQDLGFSKSGYLFSKTNRAEG